MPESWVADREEVLPASVTDVALSFVPNRTHIREVTLIVGSDEFSLTPPGMNRPELMRSGPPRWLFALGGPPVKESGARTRIRIQVRSLGEPPRLEEILWRSDSLTADRPRLESELLEAGPECTHGVTVSKSAAAASQLWRDQVSPGIRTRVLPSHEFDEVLRTDDPDREELHRRRREGVADRHSIECFFMALDFATGEPEGELAQAQRSIMQRLSFRVDYRQSLALMDPPMACSFQAIDPRSYWAKYLQPLRRVSGMIRELAEEHLPDREGRDLFDWAFEQFVTDEVVTTHYRRDFHATLSAQGAPDSLMFLRLPELAFVCIENEVDADFWGHRVASLVRAAHICLEHSVARARPQDQVYPAPLEYFRFSRGRRYPEHRRIELREVYADRLAGKSLRSRLEVLEECFGSMLGQALVPNGLRVTDGEDRPIRFRAELCAWGESAPALCFAPA